MKYSAALFAALLVFSGTLFCQEVSDGKSFSEEIGNESRQVRNHFDKMLFSIGTFVQQRTEEMEQVKYNLRDRYYSFEYEFRKGYEQGKQELEAGQGMIPKARH